MESGELKTILDELPQDDKWDLEVAVERGYSKAGLVRYHLEGLKSLTTSSHKDSYQEEITHTKSRQVTREDGQLQLQNVKPENPLHDTLQGKIQVAESGKQALEKVHSQSQDLVLELELKTSSDPAFKAKKSEMDTVSKKLGEEITKVRATIFAAKRLQPDKVTQAEVDDFCTNVENWSTLLDVSRSAIRKANQLLSS